MKRILFTHSYFLKLDVKQWQLGQPYAPLGTLYAAALMRENKYEVMLHDTMFADASAEIIPVIKSFQPHYVIIYDDGFNYLTKMCLSNMRNAAFEMIRLAKENQCTVIISSSDSTDHFEKYLQVGADFIILGEGEQTLLELIDSLESKVDDFSTIPGIAFKLDSEIKKTAKRPVLKDLDILPLPAWDLVEIELYRKTWMKHAGYFSMNIGTTRGCPFKCNWCAKPIYGNRYHARSPEAVVKELIFLKESFGFDHIWFCDDIFGLKPGWVAEFAECLQKENLKFKFKIQSRADLLVQENYVYHLYKAGCDNVWMGAESGSQKILDAMDKGITIAQIRDATTLLKKHQIKPSFFIQFGYLGETKEDIALTIKMIKELQPYEIGISVSYPLPGTVFYEKVNAQMKEKTNWTDSDDLALLFVNTYPPSFYKNLHRYVHHSFKVYRGKALILKAFQSPFSLNGKDWKIALATFWYAYKQLINKIQLKSYVPN
ncbi:B12-binding domain-containing radical SAM protein [Chitinophagaceae bacterium LB-8]|uniref:B12-binding domain-containing radical SAM protein n=1 Tax=Paraflavisolibacter caeni TaxID=2982496 RepID=A0A9X3BH53_9BACT|nr:radical SAM protein [Paraflavisolibacter caeni]MCU7548977.1 B12-binding domain-containing radical SAM protein [Paraflavisolibacter caeni]